LTRAGQDVPRDSRSRSGERSATCSGQIAIGTTCSATVIYDTLDIHVHSDAGQTVDFVQRDTIVLTASTTTDD